MAPRRLSSTFVNNYTGDRTAWEMAKELQEQRARRSHTCWSTTTSPSRIDVDRRPARRAGNFFVIKAAAATATRRFARGMRAVGEK
jgi:hypothetical protein